MKHYCYVFVATGKTKATRWRYQQISRIIRFFTLSNLCHCSIGFEDAVLDPCLGGVNYYQLKAYARFYPSLYAVVKVPLKFRIDLDWFTPFVGKRISFWRFVLRWLTFGRLSWGYDCVSVVCFCLQAGGIEIPETLTTPRGLLNWLKKEGYDVQYIRSKRRVCASS